MLNRERITEINICFIDKIIYHPLQIFVKIFIAVFVLISIIIDVYAGSGLKKNTVYFGGDPSSPPYEFLDSSSIPQGYCVDLTKAIAEEAGWEAQIVLVKQHDIGKALNSGKIDVIQRAVFNDESTKIYNYSMPYHEFGYYTFINTSDLNYFNINNIKGMKAVVLKNYHLQEYIRINNPGIIIEEKNTMPDVLSHLSGESKFYTVLDKYMAIYLLRKSGINNVSAAGDPLKIDHYRYVSLIKNYELISAINAGIDKLKNNGKLKEINNRWFGVIGENNNSVSYPVIIFLVLITAVILYLIWQVAFLSKKNKIQQTQLTAETGRQGFSSNTILECEEKSKLILENAPIGIFQFDRDGIISNCNKNFIKVINPPSGIITGMNMLTHHNQKIAELAAASLDGESGYYEGDYSASEKTICIRAMFAPVMISDGTITGGLGILEDITERKKYEESLVAAKDTAESASSIKSHFLANMSHEVRTPLNGILGMLQLLQTTGINEEQSNYVSIAIKSGMRLTRLLNDILELSRVEADKLVLNETQFSLKNIFNFIEERYITECDEKGVKLVLNIDESTPDEIVGDEIRIRQILINLVSNSVKYTKTGQINVNIHTEDISLYGAVNIIISVRDTGIGIAEDMLTRIFEPFKQSENLYRRSFQGAGLGLTLVNHLVNIMNGTIKINSIPGKGTAIECTITVKLPENQAIDIKPLSSEQTDKTAAQMTILIAEDERINRLALKRILEKLGYRIIEAENGIEVLKILETENPHCILMDIQMPEMDGIETTKLLRDRKKYGNKSDIPVIALTAYTLPEDREKIKAAGLDDFISKPVNMDYLIKSITRFVVH